MVLTTVSRQLVELSINGLKRQFQDKQSSKLVQLKPYEFR